MSKQNPEQPDGVWVSMPLHHLVLSRYKVALNIRELTALTNEFSKKYVGGCTATPVKTYPKELSWEYRVVCTKADSDPAGHEVRVKLDLSQVTSASTVNDIQVRCSCTCPAFLYWGAQWHLHQQDALEGQARPKLQAPTEQLDKRNGYLVCKHVKVTADQILPAVSRKVNDIARKLLVDQNKLIEQQEIEEAEQAIRDKEERALKLRTKRPRPNQKALPELQGPSTQERDQRRKLIEEEENRLREKEKPLWKPTVPTPAPTKPPPPVKPKPKPKKPTEQTQIRRPGVIK